MAEVKSLGVRTQEQIENLARALCDEGDSTVVELGLSDPGSLLPFDALPEQGKDMYRRMATRIYARLEMDCLRGYIVVMNKPGHRLR